MLQHSRRPVPPSINNFMATYSPLTDATTMVSNTIGAFNWPAANQAIFVPFGLPHPYVCRRFLWANGSTIGSNMDAGLYALDGRKIISTGSVAQVGTSAMQTAAPIQGDTLISPGLYFLALACDGTTLRGWGLSTITTNEGRIVNMRQQATAFALPATATFAQWASTGYPLIGMVQDV